MVDIKDKGEQLVFSITDETSNKATGLIVRVYEDASQVIESICGETGLSKSEVASALINYAGKHYTIEKE